MTPLSESTTQSLQFTSTTLHKRRQNSFEISTLASYRREPEDECTSEVDAEEEEEVVAGTEAVPARLMAVVVPSLRSTLGRRRSAKRARKGQTGMKEVRTAT